MLSPTSNPQIASENYRFLQQHVYAQSGLVVDEDKHYLFENRLTPIVRQLGLGSINHAANQYQPPGGGGHDHQ